MFAHQREMNSSSPFNHTINIMFWKVDFVKNALDAIIFQFL